jgi:uncharacterized Zn-binding protein involved in type VI secretion
MQVLITVGCMDDHSAVVSISDSSFMVDGKAVHLDGMRYFCPKCKVQSKEIASNQGFMVVGSRSIVAVGDKSTCGSKYLNISDLAVMDRESIKFYQWLQELSETTGKDWVTWGVIRLINIISVLCKLIF